MRSVWVGLAGYVGGVASMVGLLATPSVLNAQDGKGGRFWKEGAPPVTTREAPAVPAAPATQLPSLSGLVKTVGPSVVFIRTTRKHPAVGNADRSPFGGPFGPFGPFRPPPDGDGFRAEGGGSGFVVSEDGYIVTNNHVIAGAEEITVHFQDGGEYQARIVGRDPQLDVGLIKIDAKNLPVVTLGDSERLESGDWVLAMGNPLGLEHSVSVGIISGLGRRIGIGRYDALLQTDAAINPGNSGGPLFNLRGEVVGINTAIIGGANNIGFAVPINMAKEVLVDLKEHGRAIRGQLGVQLAPITPELKQAMGLKSDAGVYLQRVFADTPAEKAGLKAGDVILEYEGAPVEDMRDLQVRVAKSRPGSKVELVYQRDGKKRATKATLVEFREEGLVARAGGGDDDDRRESAERLGLLVRNVDPETMQRFGLDSPEGVLIVRVEPGSPASDADLEAGDVVIEAMVDGKRRKISSTDAFKDVVQDAGSSSLLLWIRRDGDVAAVEVRPRGPSKSVR